MFILALSFSSRIVKTGFVSVSALMYTEMLIERET